MSTNTDFVLSLYGPWTHVALFNATGSAIAKMRLSCATIILCGVLLIHHPSRHPRGNVGKPVSSYRSQKEDDHNVSATLDVDPMNAH